MSDAERIRELITRIRTSDITVQDIFLYSESMNNFAKYILKDKKDIILNAEDIEVLDILLRICNIMYNRTDLEVLPIEDGVYDLLLERYKTYDSSYQVGSESVVFKEVDGISTKSYSQKVNPLRFYTEEEWNKRVVEGFYSQDIYIENRMTPKDLSRAPFHFTDTVTKRVHDTNHEHPTLVGTLDKCKFVLMEEAIDKGVDKDENVKVLERDFFAYHIQNGILDPNRKIKIVLEFKYDGVSVEADCTNVVVSARSRGDTGIGKASDITPILEGYPFPHAGCMIGDEPLGIKFEAIMTHADLAKFNYLKNYSYANCRTAIIGLTGSSDAPLYRDLITLIPIAMDTEQMDVGAPISREAEIKFLNKYYSTKCQPLRYAVIEGDYRRCLFLIQRFLEEAEVARDFLDFMYDGIVVSYMDQDLRETLGRKNYVNKYSMAVKFNPLKKNTIFRGYTYTIGQDGSITPMIHYDQVEFYGTIHTKSTGSSYERFRQLGLRIGDIISVEYTNDVMPYVTKPDCEFNRENQNPLCEFITHCPDCGTELQISKSGKTMYCPNNNCPSRVLARMSNMMQKLNLKDFGEEKIRSLNKSFLHEIIDLTYDDVEFLGPTNAQKFIDRMNHLKKDPIYDYQIVGAIGFTGIATKKWQLILQYYSLPELYFELWMSDSLKILNYIKGIGDSIIDTLNSEMRFFEEDIQYIMNMPNVISSKGVKSGKSIRCSGFRNNELMDELRSQGYDADDNASVTKTTDILLVPYAGYTSSKTKKAGPNTLIIDVQEFIANINKYL